MKLLSNKQIEEGIQEIEVEHTFLFFWKYTEIYRKVDGFVYGFEYPNSYYELALSTYASIIGLFKFKTKP